MLNPKRTAHSMEDVQFNVKFPRLQSVESHILPHTGSSVH